MADRVASDHDALETYRVAVGRVGRTDRPEVVLPRAVSLDPDSVFELALEGDRYYGWVASSLEGDPVVRHVADNARLARERAGENRLEEWVHRVGVSVGDTVHLDEVRRGHAYGLRRPGERVVYTASEPPADSLDSIARSLDG